jgi:translation initiation factor IF-1
MTDTLKPLIHNMIESYLSEELVFEMIEEIELDEAISTFNDLPAAWKKTATSKWGDGGKGGKDSKIEVLAATKTIKSADNIISTMRKALRRDGAALVWIEMNGEPLVAVNKDSMNEYTLLYPSGQFVTKTVRQQQPGTGKFVGGRMGKYVPPRYWEHEQRSLKPTEAAEKMWTVAFETLENMNKALDEPKDSVFELAQEMKFEVRIMYPDENRLAKMKQRAIAQKGAGLKGTSSDTSLIRNRKAAVEKVVKQKITPIIDRIKAEVDTQVSNALDGKRFDFKEVEKELQRIGSISGRLQRILKSDDVRLKSSSWGDEKAKLNYDLKYLMNDLKELDD